MATPRGCAGDGSQRRSCSRWCATARPAAPENPADLARYGRPAYDLAKGVQSLSSEAAYQLAKPDADMLPWRTSRRQSTQAWRTSRTDRSRVSSFAPGVHQLGGPARVARERRRPARRGLSGEQSVVKAEAWVSLGGALVNGYRHPEATCRQRLRPTARAQTDSLSQDHVQPADDTSNTSGRWMTRGRWRTKLFDLAATQRAMLPAGADIEQSLELVQVSADTRSLLAPDRQTRPARSSPACSSTISAPSTSGHGEPMTGCGADSTERDGSSTYCWTRDGCGGSSRRVPRTRAAPREPESGAQWFLNANSKHLGHQTFRDRASASAADGSTSS